MSLHQDPSVNDLRLIRVFQLPPSQLHSSFVPSTEDEITIRDSILEIQSTIASSDEEIRYLEAALADLKAYRTGLQTSVLQHLAVLSPIRRLPAEILGEIFLFAAEGHPIQWPPEHPSSSLEEDQRRRHQAMPWVLGQVCSYWRIVAVSLPRLWSEIRMDLTSIDIFYQPRFDENWKIKFTDDEIIRKEISLAAMVKTCLDRSGKEHLTWAFKSRSERPRPCIRPIIRYLVENAERWVSVSIFWEVLATYMEDLQPARNHLLSLYKLDIKSVIWPIPEHLRIDVFEPAPKLRQLRIDCIARPSYHLAIPWSQITTFVAKLSRFEEGELTQILRQAINLESFTIDDSGALVVASLGPVYLPHLENLNGTSEIFKFITMPNLKKLTIMTDMYFWTDRTLPMLTRSQCQFTHLTFLPYVGQSWSDEPDCNVLELLSALPSITDLDLTVSRSGELIMNQFEYRQDNDLPVLLPNLERIRLDVRLNLSVDKLVDALLSRIEVRGENIGETQHLKPARLKSIELLLNQPSSLDECSKLDRLKERAVLLGADVQVSTYTY